MGDPSRQIYIIICEGTCLSPLIHPLGSPSRCREQLNDPKKWGANKDTMWAAGWFAVSVLVWVNAETVIG